VRAAAQRPDQTGRDKPDEKPSQGGDGDICALVNGARAREGFGLAGVDEKKPATQPPWGVTVGDIGERLTRACWITGSWIDGGTDEEEKRCLQ
jgi:hypothetical protein